MWVLRHCGLNIPNVAGFSKAYSTPEAAETTLSVRGGETNAISPIIFLRGSNCSTIMQPEAIHGINFGSGCSRHEGPRRKHSSQGSPAQKKAPPLASMAVWTRTPHTAPAVRKMLTAR